MGFCTTTTNTHYRGFHIAWWDLHQPGQLVVPDSNNYWTNNSFMIPTTLDAHVCVCSEGVSPGTRTVVCILVMWIEEKHNSHLAIIDNAFPVEHSV